MKIMGRGARLILLVVVSVCVVLCVLCYCVSFWFWRLRPEKKKFLLSVWRVVLLCQCLVLAGNRQFFWCGGKVLLRPEKKNLVVCLAGCAIVSVFGSGDYDRKKKF